MTGLTDSSTFRRLKVHAWKDVVKTCVCVCVRVHVSLRKLYCRALLTVSRPPLFPSPLNAHLGIELIYEQHDVSTIQNRSYVTYLVVLLFSSSLLISENGWSMISLSLSLSLSHVTLFLNKYDIKTWNIKKCSYKNREQNIVSVEDNIWGYFGNLVNKQIPFKLKHSPLGTYTLF